MAKLGNLKRKILEDNFFRPKWYSAFINPYFINRRSLYKGLKHFAAHIPKDARILDVGCGIKPYRGLFATPSYIGIDIKGGGHSDAQKHVDQFYDGKHIPFPDASFDAVLCTQVFEHADDVEALASEISRVLVPGGKAMVTMPFIYPEHEMPYDFRRFTRFEHERLMKKVGMAHIEVKKTTGFFGTFCQIFVISMFEGIRFPATILKTLLSVFVFAPIQIKGIFLDFLFRKAGPTMDYIVTAKKI